MGTNNEGNLTLLFDAFLEGAKDMTMMLVGSGRRHVSSVIVSATTRFKKLPSMQRLSIGAHFSSSSSSSSSTLDRHNLLYQQQDQPKIVIVGGGITGISTAYYLIKNHGLTNLTILEQATQPMSFTSAQSGENYRNWFPHPTMIKFTNRSIDLLEEFAGIGTAGNNRIDMTRRGYALATRHQETLDTLINELLHVQDKLHEANKQLVNDLNKVIPPQKIIALKAAEEAFKKVLVEKLQERRERRN